MFWSLSRKKKAQKRNQQRSSKRHNLRLECLESRQLLAGVVNINTTVPGVLQIFGDANENNVVLVSGVSNGEYTISAGTDETGSPTRFRLNGGAKQDGPISITDIRTDLAAGGNAAINVDLAGAKDSFTVKGTAGGKTQINGNLNILNEGTGDVNSLSDLSVNGFSINIIDDFPAPVFSPALAARPGAIAPDPAVPARATNATGVANTLAGVEVDGNVVINVGGTANNTIGVSDAIATSVIRGGLWVSSANGFTQGQNRLTVTSATVEGPTVVTNQLSGSTTDIINSNLRGKAIVGAALLPAGVPAVASTGVGLMVTNDVSGSSGRDIIHILGATVIGEKTVASPGQAPFSQNALIVRNGAGGSSVTFGVQGTGTVGPTMRGGFVLQNGDTHVLAGQDVLSMNRTTIFGPTYVYNGGGATNTTIANSWLGRSTNPSTGFGNPVVMINDAGEDLLVMINTSVPWGIFTNNDDAGGGLTLSEHRTAIMGNSDPNPLTGAPSIIGSHSSTIGANGANVLGALAAAFPSVYAGAILGQIAQPSSPFVVNGPATTTSINAATQGTVFGRVGDAISFGPLTANNGQTKTITTSITTEAQNLGTYPFGSASASNTTVNATFSAITAAVGIASFDPANGNAANAPAATPILRVEPAAATTDINVAFTNNSFFEFTVTPTAGRTLNFSRLEFDVARGGPTTPRLVGVRSDQTGVSNLYAKPVDTERPGFEHVIVDLTGQTALQNIVGAVKFQIAVAVPNAAGEVLYFDNISASSVVTGATYTTNAFANPPLNAENFTVFGPSTFAFTLPPGVAAPMIGDTVTFTNGPNTGLGRGISSVNVVGNKVTMNFAVPFPNAPSANDSFDIVRNALPAGTRLPALPGLLTSGDSLFVGGGSGIDVVNIGHNPPSPGTTTGSVAPIPFGLTSQVSILLPGGNNHVNIQGGSGSPTVATAIKQLIIKTGSGRDNVTIKDVKIDNIVNISLGLGNDDLKLFGLTSLPDPSLGGIIILNGGGPGDTDKITADPSILVGLLLPTFETVG